MRKILLIHGEGNTFNNPSLKAIIDLLSNRGYECYVRYPRSNAPMPSYPGVVHLRYGKLLKTLKHLIYNHVCSTWGAGLIVSIEDFLLYRKFDLVLAIDRLGLIEAGVLKRLHKSPFVFLSFEIMFEAETSPRFKRMERLPSKHCTLWITQDEIRAARLIRENDLDPRNLFILPLASAGSGQFSVIRLRDQLGIPENYKVAIMMGSLTEWSMARETIDSVRSWPPDWALLVHERYGNTQSALDVLGMRIADLPDRIYFSAQAPDLVDDLGYVLGGVSAGLAFYRPTHDSPFTGANLENLGLSSGKISTYLRYGIPVICNEIGLYAEEIRKHGIGAVIDHPADIARALPLTAEPAAKAARDYFRNALDFNIKSAELEYRLERAMTTGRDEEQL